MRHEKPHMHEVLPTLLVALLLTALPALAVPMSHPMSHTAELSDDTIAEVIANRLAKRELSSTVGVSVADGVVTLTGSVDTLAERRQAERLAMKADDVQRVINDLRVRDISRTSQEIARDISTAIDNYVLYNIFDWVEGRVQNGRVMLEGYVTAPWKKEDLAQRIERIQGVRAIENTIEVLSPVDDDLRISLARRIYGDLMFLGRGTGANPPIHIVVHDGGDVSLEGVVRTQVEKHLASSLARTHPWTFEVENNLIVPTEERADASPSAQSGE